MTKISYARSLFILTIAVLSINVALQAKTHQPPKSQATKSQATKTTAKRITWRLQLKPALIEAQRSGKPVLLYFYSESCPPCRAMNAKTYTHASVIEATAAWIPIKINGEMELEAAYEYKVASFPKIVFLKPDGTIAAEASGFRTAEELLQSMQSARSVKQ